MKKQNTSVRWLPVIQHSFYIQTAGSSYAKTTSNFGFFIQLFRYMTKIPGWWLILLLFGMLRSEFLLAVGTASFVIYFCYISFFRRRRNEIIRKVIWHWTILNSTYKLALSHGTLNLFVTIFGRGLFYRNIRIDFWGVRMF